MLQPWYESDRIIFACYHSGAGGYALRYLLGLSPHTDVQLWDHNQIRPDGAAHSMLDSNGLRAHLSDKHPLRFRELIKEDVWAKIPDPRLVEHIKQILAGCYSYDGDLMQERSQQRQVVIVDHLPIRMVRTLFPNAKVLKLTRDPFLSMRYFFIKNYMQSPSQDSHQFDDTTAAPTALDAILLVRGEPQSYINYKKTVRWRFNEIAGQIKDMGDDAYDVDGDRLFDPVSWLAEYQGLVAHCELIPNLKAAEEFIKEYHSKQFNRLTYIPKPDWGWVNAAYF